jgi:hypothetical protein
MRRNHFRKTIPSISDTTFGELLDGIKAHHARRRRGAPARRSARFMLFAVLLRLKSAMPLRLMARLPSVDHVTLWRICATGIRLLANLFDQTVPQSSGA